MNRYQKLCLLTLTLLLHGFTCHAQKAKRIVNQQQLTDSIRSLVKQRHIPGLMVGITSKDSVLYSASFGYADVAKKKTVNPNTLFRMGSITKSLIAVAMLKLAEQGKLSLTDRLKNLAPEVPFNNPWEATNPIRVQDLLEQTTGFDDFKLGNMYSLQKRKFTTKAMMLRQTASMVSRWRPGERYTYCNVNYVILGYLITKLTGQEYDDYLTQHVLLPLGMTNSNFNIYSKTQYDAREYRLLSSGQAEAVPSVTFLAGSAGSLWSNTEDMLRLVRFYLNSGYPILSGKSITRMETPKVTLAARAGLKSGYAVGNEDYGTFRGHDGKLGTFNSSYRYNRSLGIGFVIACNAGGMGNIENLLTSYLINSKTTRTVPIKTIPVKASETDAYVGCYQAADARFELLSFIDQMMLVNIEKKEGQLYFSIFGKKHLLLQTAPGIFMQPSASEPTIAFTKNEDDHTVLIINKHYCEKVPAIIAYGKISVIMVALASVALSLFAGLFVIIQWLSGKTSKEKLWLFTLLMLSALCLLRGGWCVLEVKQYNYLLYQLSTVTLRSITIAVSFTLSPMLTIIAIPLLIKYRSAISRYTWFYLIVTVLSLIILDTLLIQHGWFGLCTWIA